MKKQIFVVEGKNDVTRLKQVFPNINVLSVNGSAINQDIIDILKERVKEYEIVLCFDPDYPGEKIRTYITQEIKDVSHIFVPRAIAHSKNHKKIGIEHLSDENIKKYFAIINKQTEIKQTDVTLSFLFEHKIIGHENSKEIRLKLAKELNLGHVNGKKIIERFKQFNLNKTDILKHL